MCAIAMVVGLLTSCQKDADLYAIDAQIAEAAFSALVDDPALFQPCADQHHGKQCSLKTEQICEFHPRSSEVFTGLSPVLLFPVLLSSDTLA